MRFSYNNRRRYILRGAFFLPFLFAGCVLFCQRDEFRTISVVSSVRLYFCLGLTVCSEEIACVRTLRVQLGAALFPQDFVA